VANNRMQANLGQFDQGDEHVPEQLVSCEKATTTRSKSGVMAMPAIFITRRGVGPPFEMDIIPSTRGLSVHKAQSHGTASKIDEVD